MFDTIRKRKTFGDYKKACEFCAHVNGFMQWHKFNTVRYWVVIYDVKDKKKG